MATAKIRCEVERLIAHGEHVYTIELALGARAPRYQPGQFLHLALDDYDPGGFWPESRVFSIASSPEQRETVRITYSVRGRYTARMEHELAVGRRVWIKLPYGDFTVAGTRDVVLCAGGTGITAFTAFLEGLGAGYPFAVYVLYGARSPSLLVYKSLVQQAAQLVPRLQAWFFVDNVPSGQVSDRLRAGAVSLQPAWAYLASPSATDYYLSGPPAMLRMLTLDLAARGIAPDAVHTDAWD
jgi:ferredoxin-NADP reductase